MLRDHHGRRRDAEQMVRLRAIIGNEQAMLRRESDCLEHGLHERGVSLEGEFVGILQ